MNVSVERIYPPIPIRSFDWCAVDADKYEAGQPIGFGPTRCAAISDLLEQIEDSSVNGHPESEAK